jgi:hypothetical protein
VYAAYPASKHYPYPVHHRLLRDILEAAQRSASATPLAALWSETSEEKGKLLRSRPCHGLRQQRRVHEVFGGRG